MYNIYMSKTSLNIIVIGAGASGLMAAGIAAGQGAAVRLIEKTPVYGRKLSMTGNGRCNITNTTPISEFSRHYHSSSRFLRHALHSFTNLDCINFFEGLGRGTTPERFSFHEEDNGRVLPVNSNGHEISVALAKWAVSCGVKIIPNISVTKLLVDNNMIKGVEAVDSDKNVLQMQGDSVIIATGGKSYPKTGSTGDGYELAKSVGHSIIPLRPALVPIETQGDLTKRLQGVSLPQVMVTLWINNLKSMTKIGDLIFTHYGVSGPLILNLSRFIVDALRTQSDVTISIDLFPNLDHPQIQREFSSYITIHKKQLFNNLLINYLPKKMIQVCCEELNISGDKMLNQLSAKELKRLRLWLKSLTLKVSGYRTFDEAMITAGGVDTDEVDPKTMQSKIVKGLYFAGEALDIDAETGGFNLQAAFSTGWLAGKSCTLRSLPLKIPQRDSSL
ncbi:MAG: NAD(P)/FAD-dependent oxidoreductase [Nitrospirae bacterium]|nr:NAD(P)/FAD-dependent oxidoreductase [Nitrospirota bacterium]MBF0542044.1 NAD(P)/FAD-dependent oxidoreductase [Nitrospirota bacterium]